jgi:hypothetical protein
LKTVIEPASFLNDIRSSGMSENEHSAIIASIAQDSDQGAVMAETGGARKVRFAGRGKGKSGGYRIVFYSAPADVPVLMLAPINKGERENLSRAERNELRKELAGYVEDYRATVKARAGRVRYRRRK